MSRAKLDLMHDAHANQGKAQTNRNTSPTTQKQRQKSDSRHKNWKIHYSDEIARGGEVHVGRQRLRCADNRAIQHTETQTGTTKIDMDGYLETCRTTTYGQKQPTQIKQK